MTKLLASLCICIAIAPTALAQKDRLTAADLVTRHTASAGSPEAIKVARSRILLGHGTLSSKLGYLGKLDGPAQIASDGEKFLLAMIFNSRDYPSEKLAYDGSDITYGRTNGNINVGNLDSVAHARSVRRLTLLGEFIRAQAPIVKSGLFGGVLSSGWPFIEDDQKKVKTEYAGTESVDGRVLHKLRVRPSAAGDLRVTLFFEAESFRHVASQYRYTIHPHMISANSTVNATAKASHFTLTERFSDFKKVNDLVLPLGYSITVTCLYPESAEELTWTLAFSRVFFNEKIEPEVFQVR